MIRSFVAGMIDSDGNVDKTGRVQYTTHSERLGHDFQNLLGMGLGIRSSLSSVDCSKYGGTKSNGVGFYVRTTGDRRKLSNIPSDKIQSRISNVSGRSVFERVVSIEPSTNDVFDVSVEGDPSYLVQGFYSHNSSESIQVLEENGIVASHQSVDRSDEAYLAFINLLFEGRVRLYYYEVTDKELFDLIHYRDRRKIDHPIGGSKDVCDAIVGAVWNALNSQDEVLSAKEDASTAASVMIEEDEESLFDLEELLGGYEYGN